ncbi:MAG: glycosyltransferase [Terrimicrobiaceae bacterium]|nr:glycosyltransferase [Terrimicrobiaceae bacterium]
MNIRLFYHSVISDWNNGHAHFLRGVVTELVSRGHDVVVLEPVDSWSLRMLVQEHGEGVIDEFREAFPAVSVKRFESLGLINELADADVVIVHEWNDPALVAELGHLRAAGAGFRLLFHDTHHRAVSEPNAMEAFDLRHFDGALVFGDVLRRIYLERGWARNVWTWHEAADARLFHPCPGVRKNLDLVWVGNWGDGERTEELHEFLIEPVRRLGLRAEVYGVRYEPSAVRALARAGIAYRGRIANADVPKTFARARVTVHVPRRPYASQLPGIPTIRPFEAMACGIPLVSGPWQDTGDLFRPGVDFLFASDGVEMERHLSGILADPDYANSLAAAGRETILRRHTCAHRVDELLGVVRSLEPAGELVAG